MIRPKFEYGTSRTTRVPPTLPDVRLFLTYDLSHTLSFLASLHTFSWPILFQACVVTRGLSGISDSSQDFTIENLRARINNLRSFLKVHSVSRFCKDCVH
jgi:hypothetical protein